MDRSHISPAKIARRRWELENSIPDEDTPTDSTPDPTISAETIKILMRDKPWLKQPHYFERAKISALALLKMVMHARSGGKVEIMGLMQGKIGEHEMIVTDAFALPVEGTETKVNALADANEYAVAYTELSKQVGRLENVIGWYHSHPGYGCWLSGIDVSTQRLNQTYQDPFLAVVIDPTRTVSAGKVDIGAFRTYPHGYKPLNERFSEYQSIPSDKIEDFGVHSKQYYSLEITHFKSSLDSHLLNVLWNKHWMNTLSSSPLLANRDVVAGEISDLAEKIELAESKIHTQSLSHTQMLARTSLPSLTSTGKIKVEESALSEVTRDSKKMTSEQIHDLMAQVIKHVLFNSVGKSNQS